MRNQIIIIAVIALFGFGALQTFAKGTMRVSETVQDTRPMEHPSAIFGGGCFWCVESEFRALDGVTFTRVGYAGGELDHPSYRDITTGKSGHAEVVEVVYDPSLVSYRALVDFFLTQAHDPTQVNRQGVDVGPQYRSVIFYQDETQKMVAEEAITTVNASGQYADEVVTELSPLPIFWQGEEYHQQYYEKYEAETGRPHIRVLLKQNKR